MMLNFIMKSLNMNVYTNVYVLKGEKMFNFFQKLVWLFNKIDLFISLIKSLYREYIVPF